MSLKNYYEIDVQKIRQIQDGIVLLGKLKYQELYTIHKLTERKESIFDPFDAKQKKIQEEDEEFQRQLRPNKLNKIANYLKEQFELYKQKKSIGLFPTSIIVSLQHEIEYSPDQVNQDYLEEVYSNELDSCFINKTETELFIPKNSKIALIVDGQHRFYGVKKFYDSLEQETDKKIIENFEFPTTFLIGFDLYQVGSVFATVNFTQKPVSRSLYYDIFGSVPDPERNEIKLAHDLALHLNNNKESPLYNMIKMLGKGYGLISQSFFVESMLVHFKEDGVWEKIYSDYIRRGKEYKKLPIFMRVYLNCVEESYNVAWPVKMEKNEELVYSPYNYDYILCKTTGLGAFFMLIKEIYPQVENLSEVEMKTKILNIFKIITKKESESLFSKEEEYGKGGGRGLQLKLYRYLKSKLKL